MTPEQTEMFKLQNTCIPGQPSPQAVVKNRVGQTEPEMDQVNQGLALTMSHMAQNGPARPIQRGQAKTMTKDQYKEQMMNEEKGLPSNLDEASRVVSLEQKVKDVDSKLDQILVAITGGLLNVPPPTPQAKPAAVPQPPPVQPGQLRYHPPLPTNAPVTETPIAEVPASLPATSQQPSLPLASQETAPPTSPLSLGPVGSQGPDPTNDDVSLEEDVAVVLDQSSSSENIGIDALIEESGTPAVDPVEEKRLERQQILTDQVSTWLGTKNPHSFWKKFLSSACNKNLSYNTWPLEFRNSFDKRFQQMIGDPTFISTLCGRIVKMQNGHLVAPNVAGAFIVVIAGMLSFALLEG